VSESHERCDHLLGDVCDASFFKDHPLFGGDPLALQLFIYFDEVEVCNPLGHARGIHKLGTWQIVVLGRSSYSKIS
jgi:hypothetical protein